MKFPQQRIDQETQSAAVALILDQGTKLLMLYGLGFSDMGPRDNIAIRPACGAAVKLKCDSQ